MAADIFIIAGFLGAGKTTLIQKLIREVFQDKRTAVVENDFGEESVDASLLGASGVMVNEINSGCICCSLSGNFVRAFGDMLDQFKPDHVIIEPSGVAKLSDVVLACEDPRIAPLAGVRGKITVVDVNSCKKYIDNFGEFFEDQIQHADTVLLSKIDAPPGDKTGKAEEAAGIIRELNGSSRIFADPWSRIDSAEILYPAAARESIAEEDAGCCNSPDSCDHNHDAEDVFDEITLRPGRQFSREDLESRMFDIERFSSGEILRAKGIVRGEDGYLNIQYIPGDLRVESTSAAGDIVCFIGRGLNRQELAGLLLREAR
ncbi:MAG: GTP-binding protein [Synergistaceae bacterium]|jgi:G3E family GTPase|nr:GTP-binding protein [Synergistaceae bacterium]